MTCLLYHLLTLGKGLADQGIRNVLPLVFLKKAFDWKSELSFENINQLNQKRGWGSICLPLDVSIGKHSQGRTRTFSAFGTHS